MNSGGDVLARGARSAQFAAGSTEVTEFEYDLRTNEGIVGDKYGLSESEIFEYKNRMDAGERLSLDPVNTESTLESEIKVIDRRPNFMGAATGESEVAKQEAPKYPVKAYGSFSPILDRVLIKRCTDDPDMEVLEDGSARNKKTGLIIAAKYRQHSNVGIVLATGTVVILGGQRIPMEEIVSIGDRVTYGDYNSEVFVMDEKKVRELCDRVQMNYTEDPEGIRIVRVQDIRGFEREIPNIPEYKVCKHVCGSGGSEWVT